MIQPEQVGYRFAPATGLPTELFAPAVVRDLRKIILYSFFFVSVSGGPDTFSYSAELKRKALHLFALIIPLGMWWLGSPAALYLVGGFTMIAVTADVVRAYSPPFNEWIRAGFGPLMRAEELPSVGEHVTLNGATCVLMGATLLTLVFPLRVAVPVLTMTMLADAAAALVGRRIGRHPWGSLSATIEGSAAFVATGLLVMAWFPTLAFGPVLASVVVATVIEALPLPLNDNIRVPLAAAAALVAVESVLLDRPLHLFTTLPG